MDKTLHRAHMSSWRVATPIKNITLNKLDNTINIYLQLCDISCIFDKKIKVFFPQHCLKCFSFLHL